MGHVLSHNDTWHDGLSAERKLSYDKVFFGVACLAKTWREYLSVNRISSEVLLLCDVLCYMGHICYVGHRFRRIFY